jgi:putative transcriptional regulator
MKKMDSNRFAVIGLASLVFLCISGFSGLSCAGADQGFGLPIFRHGENLSGIVSSPPFHSGSRLSAGKFLVAAENMTDPRFRESVILICRYDSNGVMGLIINRPTGVKLDDIWPDVEGIQKIMDTVYVGGPVGIEQLFLLVRSESPPEESLHVFRNIYLSSSLTILKELIAGVRKNDDFRVYAGYAGWNPEQLDREVSRGDWHVFEGDDTLIFDRNPSTIWPDLILRTSVIQVRL